MAKAVRTVIWPTRTEVLAREVCADRRRYLTGDSKAPANVEEICAGVSHRGWFDPALGRVRYCRRCSQVVVGLWVSGTELTEAGPCKTPGTAAARL